jgi:ferritin-like metal-binding protein YciE
MSLHTLQDLLVEQLRDIYSAETQITKALPKLVKNSSNDALARAFSWHLSETEGQIDRLEQIFQLLNESPRGKRCRGMHGLLEEGTETLNQPGDGAVRDAALIADAQRVEHYEIAAYGTAKALARQLGQEEIVTLIEQNEQEEVATDRKLTDIAEREVNPQAATAGAGADARE